MSVRSAEQVGTHPPQGSRLLLLFVYANHDSQGSPANLWALYCLPNFPFRRRLFLLVRWWHQPGDKSDGDADNCENKRYFHKNLRGLKMLFNKRQILTDYQNRFAYTGSIGFSEVFIPEAVFFLPVWQIFFATHGKTVFAVKKGRDFSRKCRETLEGVTGITRCAPDIPHKCPVRLPQCIGWAG